MRVLPPTLPGGFSLLVMAFFLSSLAAQSDEPQLLAPPVQPDISFRNEVQHAIDRGLAWLQANQNSNGWWSTPDHPAVTGLALMSFKGDPAGRYDRQQPVWLDRGYSYILDCVHPDGGIYRTNLVTYNTSICMMALLVARQPEYEATLVKARRCLVGLQNNFNGKDTTNALFNGGIGYGDHYDHTDMGNTLYALEALHYTKQLVGDKRPGEPDLNWNAAIQFLQNCQNLPSHNPQTWVADDPQNRGGFVYYPGNSNAGSITNAATGRVALRSYGSVSYAGLLSYIYADLIPDDPRVTAAYDWLRRNYTLDENPGMGPQGLYYYYHTMAKALTAYGVVEIELANGEKVPWRKQLGLKLLNLQQKDGSWANDNNRWWEKDPSLVTAYSVLSLEMIYHGL
jgi:squalene-hopene/tetraprenyl-beta-curcumene cyclase